MIVVVMNELRIIAAADLVPRAWKNGGGVTWEIAIDPPGASLEEFRWRVSRARIEAEGPFSLFPGCDRWITCIEGAGFALHFDDGVKLPVPPMMPVRFSGDRPTVCRLAEGPCTDINLIFRRDLVRAEIAIVDAPAELPPGGGSALRERGAVVVRLDAARALRAVLKSI
jgi:uncharacterized protein